MSSLVVQPVGASETWPVGGQMELTCGTEWKAAGNINNNGNELAEYIVDHSTKTTYLKGRFLGKGGFARVHELTDLTTNKVYAGKIIPKSRITKAHHKEKIAREVELQRHLVHKHVVKFHHYFEDEDNVYIILENCPRKSLVHVLKYRKTLTEPEVRFYIRQLVDGLRYVHNKDVIHRDLKLGNMFLSENMEVKIGDFGLAAKKEVIEGKKITVCGTPNYIAPEVLTMQSHGVEADIWAIGCILYAMLAGNPPFETYSLKETYSRIIGNNFKIPSSISEDASDLIRALLSPNPSERPTLKEVLTYPFFTRGFTPVKLSSSCCTTCPNFSSHIISNTKENNFSKDIKKINSHMSMLCLNTNSQQKTASNKTNKMEKATRKESSFKGILKEKISCVLFSEKSGKKSKGCSTRELYDMVLTCLDNMSLNESSKKAPVVSNPSLVFINKWIDYSNKYGFGFQLSDHSVGVLFNDSTRMSLTSDKSHVEYHDVTDKCSTYSINNIPSSLEEQLMLLNHFAQYMDENLTEGGDLKTTKRKGAIPTMKRWVRTSKAIVMQLSNGTLQINFFKDHTKIVVSGEKQDYLVTFINENRQAQTFRLVQLAYYGCDINICDRLHNVLSVLKEFCELEEDEL